MNLSMEFTGPKPTGSSRQTNTAPDRRNGVRLRAHSPAYASLDESSPEKAGDLSEILDISEEGMSIQTSSPLEVGHNLNLSLDLSETKTRINTSGRVVWSDSSGRAGITFPKLAGPYLHQLREWLFVNVLTAFDNAHSRATPVDADKGNSISSPQALSQDTAGNELPPGVPVHSGNPESPAPLNDLENKVKSGEYGRRAALQLIAEQALASTRAAGAAIALSQDDAMMCVASAGPDAPPLGTPLQVGSGFSGECVRTGRSLRCDDSETDDRVDRQGCRILGIRSMVAVPIRRNNRVAGLLEVFSAQPYAFNSQDISVLQQLTGIILSVMGTEAGVASPVLPQAPATEGTPTRIESQPLSEFMAGTRASTETARPPSLHKILLVAAAITFVFALLWSIAPWIRSRMGEARSTPQVQQPPVAASRHVDMPVDVNDLASLRQVAERGDPAAQFALGARYATGEEVKQDYTEAVRWFSLAADQGHILAQATLGAYYWAGRGVPADLTKAYFWSALAQAGGDQASKYRVAVLTSRMSRADILAAQQQANDWLRSHQMAGNVHLSH